MGPSFYHNALPCSMSSKGNHDVFALCRPKQPGRFNEKWMKALVRGMGLHSLGLYACGTAGHHQGTPLALTVPCLVLR